MKKIDEQEYKRSKRGILVKDFRDNLFDDEFDKMETMECVVPSYCPICNTLMRDNFDAEYYQKSRACYSCCVYFAPELSKGIFNFKFGPFPQEEDIKASLKWRERKQMLMGEEKRKIIEGRKR